MKIWSNQEKIKIFNIFFKLCLCQNKEEQQRSQNNGNKEGNGKQEDDEEEKQRMDVVTSIKIHQMNT